MTIIAAADGSSLGNPGPAGWAWYIDEASWQAGGMPCGTNNQGELLAVLNLLQATAHLPEEEIQILCDSQYVIKSVTEWMPGWKRRGWRKADGSNVLNQELLQALDRELAGRKYQFQWVKGHAGHELNEAADLRARAVAIAYQNGAEPEHGPGLRDSPERDTSPQDEPPLTESPLTLWDDESPVASGQQATAEKQNTSEILSQLQVYDAQMYQVDATAKAQLLTEDFEEIGRNGRLWSREEALMEGVELRAPELVGLSAQILGDSAILSYRVFYAEGSAIQVSHWVLQGQWRLRLRQSTPEM